VEGSFDCTWADNFDDELVSVAVSDGDGGTDTASISVDIANLAPVVTAPADQTADEGTAASFDLGSFSDPGDDDPWTVSVDWGDGSTETFADSETTDGDIIDRSHTYADDGTYTVTVTVRETGGPGAPQGAASFDIVVANLAPTTSNPTFIYDQISGIGTASFDFSDAGWLDTHTAQFTWTIDGVPTTQSGTVIEENVPPDATGTATDTFDMEPGCHTITVTGTVTDDDGGAATQPIVTGMSGVDVFLASFEAPIKDNERNIAKYGNVVPVKVRLASSCTGAVTTAPELYITVIKGSTIETYGEEFVATSVSGADTGNRMRVVDSRYMFNLSTKGYTPNTNYEIRIRVGSTFGPIIAKAVLYPKK
jgi:hypothetical protein